MTPFALFLICLGLVFVFFALSILLTPSAASGAEPIGRGTRLFLVALRLAIGWHFMVEGMDKLNNPSWTSEHYLRAASGPFADHFRGVADEQLLAKLTLGPNGEFPETLAAEWQIYTDAFVQEFQPEKNAEEFRDKAQLKMAQAREETRKWFLSEQEVKKFSPYVTRTDTMTVPQRVAYYQKLVGEINNVLAREVAPYGSAAENKLKLARDEADEIIKGLKSDLARQTEAMKTKLRDVLPDDAKRANLPPMPAPPVSEWTQLQWSDHIVPWGLTIVGGLLIVGFLTRPACLLGAVFLLMLYLTMMPLPGWPEPARTEGHYLFINKNFIEMLALLTLATTRSGRWFGLDALFGLLFRRRSKERPRGGPVPLPGATDYGRSRTASAS
jgi:uncharacterized membrane protein YphA (DoxX/SURF4 family)